jgi:hypothetical protein
MSKDLLLKVLLGIVLICLYIIVSFVIGFLLMFLLKTFGWVQVSLNFWQTTLVGIAISTLIGLVTKRGK